MVTDESFVNKSRLWNVFDFESWLNLLKTFNISIFIRLVWVETEWTRCVYISPHINKFANTHSWSCMFCCFANNTMYIGSFTIFSLDAFSVHLKHSKNWLNYFRKFHSFLANSIGRYWLPIPVVHSLLKTGFCPKVQNWFDLNLCLIYNCRIKLLFSRIISPRIIL